MKTPLPLLACVLLGSMRVHAKPLRWLRMELPANYLQRVSVNSPPTPMPSPVTSQPSCEPLNSATLSVGSSTWTLAPWNGRGCVAPHGVADTGSHRLQTVLVPTRSVIALHTEAGLVELVGAGNQTVLLTQEGFCAAGVRTGVAIVDPGTYVLRATNAGDGPRTVLVESLPVPAHASLTREPWIPMSTAAREDDLRCAGEGADVRVLACPNGRRATLSAPHGMVASVEGPGATRACFAVSAGHAQRVALPTASFAVLRAWPYGAERGAAFIDLR